jgi:transcriptional regulator with XRE-family HTH domain
VATEAFITPGLVRWARERVRRSPEEAASRLGVKPEQWEAWESGDRRPTLRQAQALARSLYIPFGYLYLPTPPSNSRCLISVLSAMKPPVGPPPNFPMS